MNFSDKDLEEIKNGEKWWKETRERLYLHHKEWLRQPKIVKLPLEPINSDEEE